MKYGDIETAYNLRVAMDTLVNLPEDADYTAAAWQALMTLPRGIRKDIAAFAYQRIKVAFHGLGLAYEDDDIDAADPATVWYGPEESMK